MRGIKQTGSDAVYFFYHVVPMIGALLLAGAALLVSSFMFFVLVIGFAFRGECVVDSASMVVAVHAFISIFFVLASCNVAWMVNFYREESRKRSVR